MAFSLGCSVGNSVGVATIASVGIGVAVGVGISSGVAVVDRVGAVVAVGVGIGSGVGVLVGNVESLDGGMGDNVDSVVAVGVGVMPGAVGSGSQANIAIMSKPKTTTSESPLRPLIVTSRQLAGKKTGQTQY